MKGHSQHAYGLYHAAAAGQPASIELFVDRIFDGVPMAIQRIPVLRDLLLGPILYHEVGHHIERSHRRTNPELTADMWSRKLMATHMRKKHWYALPVIRLLARGSRSMDRASAGH